MHAPLGALLSGLLLGSLAAQAPSLPTPTLEVRLADDHERHGPPTLTWVREAILPRLPGWKEGRDPLGPLSLRIDGSGMRLLASAATPLPDDSYLRARLRIGGQVRVEMRGDVSGLESWHGSGLDLATGRLHDLIVLLGLDHQRDPLTLDTAAVVGNLLAGADSGDPLHTLLTSGPIDCGEVTLKVSRHGADFEAWGRSRGGLLLPALMALLADLQARPTPQSMPASRPRDDIEHWALLALAARGAERAEAARQLTLFRSHRARQTLERLLHAGDATRLVAIDALSRMGAVSSLPRLVEAASPSLPGSEAMVEAALSQLLPRADAEQRAACLSSLAAASSTRLRSWPARFRHVVTAGFDQETQTTPHQSGKRVAILAGLLASLLALGYLVRRGRP